VKERGGVARASWAVFNGTVAKLGGERDRGGVSSQRQVQTQESKETMTKGDNERKANEEMGEYCLVARQYSPIPHCFMTTVLS